MPLQYNASDASSCWPEGEYDATLQHVEDKQSSKGNPMQVWTFQTYDPSGRELAIKEYVVVPAATFKIKQLAKALNRAQDFEAGRFQADDYIGSNLRLKLTIESQHGYDDKNRVDKFLPAGGGLQRSAPLTEADVTRTLGAGPQPRPKMQATAAVNAGKVGDHQPVEEDDIPF